jgi:hypothetical protein
MPTTAKPKPKPKPQQEDPVAAAKAYLAGLESSSEPWGGQAQALAPPPPSFSRSDPAVASGADIPTNGGLPPIGTEALEQANRLAARNRGVATRATPGGVSILDALLGATRK